MHANEHEDAKRDALAWLAGRQQWERLLTTLQANAERTDVELDTPAPATTRISKAA